MPQAEVFRVKEAWFMINATYFQITNYREKEGGKEETKTEDI